MNKIDQAIIELTNREESLKLTKQMKYLLLRIAKLKTIRSISLVIDGLLIIGLIAMAIVKFM